MIPRKVYEDIIDFLNRNINWYNKLAEDYEQKEQYDEADKLQAKVEAYEEVRDYFRASTIPD